MFTPLLLNKLTIKKSPTRGFFLIYSLFILIFVKNMSIQSKLHKLKRFFQKSYIVVCRYGINESHKKHTDYERECVTICKHLILKRSTALLISPISNKRYIKSDDKSIFIIIEIHQMTIVNHSYSYTIDIFGKTFERLSKIFDQEVEKRRQEMETEIRSNVKHSLSNIYEALINNKIQ